MLNILLAEDNPGDVLLVRQALDEHKIGHELRVFRDGADAISYVGCIGTSSKAPCPDLILLDINLPKADGPQVLRELRKNPQCAHTPVIMVTSSDAQRDRAQAAELGVARYFKKPSDLDEYLRLGAVVREVMREHSAASSAKV